METSITYNLAFEEYHGSARLARIHLTGRPAIPAHRALAKSGFITLFVISVFMLACHLLFGIQFDRSQGILIIIAAGLMGLFYLPFLERQVDRRAYKDGKWNEPTVLTVREDHISMTLPDAVEIRIPWSYFSYIETEKMLLLLAPTKWLLLPKHHVPEDALARIRTIVPLSKGKL
jgi:hypothetical protein